MEPHIALRDISTFQIGFGGRHERIWGNVDGVPVTGGTWPREFFRENLPALFLRELRFDRVELNGGRAFWLLWGREGGVDIEVEEGRIKVRVRYFDSTAFIDFEARDVHRFPQRVFREQTDRFRGALCALTVQVDYHHRLRVDCNGRVVFTFPDFPLDLHRHQLGLTGARDGGLQGALRGPSARDVEVVVSPAAPRQEMLGFGGTTTPTAYVELSEPGRRRFWELMAEYNLRIHRDYPMGEALRPDLSNQENIAEAKPSYYANNPPNSEVSNWGIVRNIRQLGGILVFEFWDLPSWVMQDWDGPEFDRVADPIPYAELMVACTRRIEESTGRPPEIVGIQNELRQPPEIWKAMTIELRDRLDAAGYRDVKIHMPNLNRMFNTIKALPFFPGDPEVWSRIDYSSTNIYDFQDHFDDPDAYDDRLVEWRRQTGDRPFLCIELCLNEPRYQWPSYRAAFTMGQMYHKVLSICDAVAIGYCWTILNVAEPSFGWTRSLMMPDLEAHAMPVPSSHQLRIFGAYSRRIRRGMRRLAVEAPDRDLLVTAFADAGGRCTAVLLNRSVAPARVRLVWPGAVFDTIETAGLYHPNIADRLEDGRAGPEVIVPPGTVVTLTNVDLLKLPEPFEPCIVPGDSETSR
jgi:hypothetical protein